MDRFLISKKKSKMESEDMNLNKIESIIQPTEKTKKISRKKKNIATCMQIEEFNAIENDISTTSLISSEEKKSNTKTEKKIKEEDTKNKPLNEDLSFGMKKLNLEEHYNTEIKIKDRKIISNIFPIEGPQLVCLEVDRLLSLYYIKNHKYIALRTIGDETHPVFFILLSSDWGENNEIPCQFVKHITWIDDDGGYHVQPEWDQLWKYGMLHKKFIYNCIPFDETKDYYYYLEE